MSDSDIQVFKGKKKGMLLYSESGEKLYVSNGDKFLDYDNISFFVLFNQNIKKVIRL